MKSNFKHLGKPFLFINDSKETLDKTKAEILDLATSNKKRPKTKTELYQRFIRYTQKKYPTYDKEFTSKLKDLRPEWFKSSNENSYNKLLTLMPKNVRMKENQEWMGVAYKYTFLDEELGYFTRTAQSVIDAWKTGCSGHPRDSYNKKAIQYSVKVKNLTTGQVFNSLKEAANNLNMSAMNLSRCLRKKQKTAGGYQWDYFKG